MVYSCLLLGLPHLSHPDPRTLHYHTIPVHHSLQGKRNVQKQWADSLKQTSARNAWNFSQLETKRPFPGSCAFKARRCDKPMVSPCWLMTLRAANLHAAPKWLGPVLRVKSRRLRWCCPPSWSSLSSCLGVRSFEAHLENKWNNQWGPWGPAEIVSVMLILKVWRAYDAQTCPDYLPPELRLWNEVSNAIS